MNTNKFLIYLIMIIHFLIILFVLLTPFIAGNMLLIIYLVIIPGIIIHWILGDNSCCLTLMEHKLRESNGETVDKNDTIMGRIINPFYDFDKDNNSLSYISYSLLTLLWMIAFGRLMYNIFYGSHADFCGFVVN